MLKIRLMRIGAKKRPFYRVVVVDERAKRTGGYVELVGTYDPLTQPKDVKLKKDRIDYWIKQGAQMSTGYLRIIGKAPQRLPRKPKKAKKEESPAKTPEQTTPKAENETSTEEPKSETQSTSVIPNVSEESQDLKTESGDSSPKAQNDNTTEIPSAEPESKTDKAK